MQNLAVECTNFPIRIYINCQIVYNDSLIKSIPRDENGHLR